jgi:hypothetical protein
MLLDEAAEANVSGLCEPLTLVRGHRERVAGAVFLPLGNTKVLGQTAVAPRAGNSTLGGGRGQSSRGRC